MVDGFFRSVPSDTLNKLSWGIENIQYTVLSGSGLPALPVAADTCRYTDPGQHQCLWNHLEIDEKVASGCGKSGMGAGKDYFSALNSFSKCFSQTLS